MTIRDILLSALRRIGRDDIISDMGGGGIPRGEMRDVVDTLLYCINATEDELARYYFPLKCTETLYSSADNLFYFSDFSHTPVRIVSVKSGGAEISYELKTNCLAAGAKKIEITYFYTPAKKTLDDASEFGDMADGDITALGAAAEYSLLCGELSMAETWETRYREAIDRARKTANTGAYVPPRRWI